MEPPPLSTPIPTTTTAAPPPPSSQTTSLPQLNYPNSLISSPRSRKTNSWEEPPYGPAAATAATKLRLICSYGGRIVPRPHDKSLCYVSGDTRIIVVDRLTSLSDLQFRLSKSFLNGKAFTLKYQLPSEDLDSLISVTTDEDLENMVEEYDRILLHSSNPTSKTSRIRLFLFPPNLDAETTSSIESILEGSKSHQDWFFTALNWNSSACKERPFSVDSSVNCLLGLDDSVQIPAEKSDEVRIEVTGSMKNGGKASNSAQDVLQSVPGSPLLETTSSFGSSSSSPTTANSPPVKVHHVDEVANPMEVVGSGLGIEEQFHQMNIVGCVGIKNQEEAPAAAEGTVDSGLPVVVGGEYPNPVLSDDEKSDHGFPVGFSKSPQLQQQQLASHGKPPGGFDLPSPDSVSSDVSVTNMQKPVVHQEQTAHIQPGNGMNLGNQIGTREGDIANVTNMQKPVVHQEQTAHIQPGNGMNLGNKIVTREGDIARMQMQPVQFEFDQYQQMHQQQQFAPSGAQYIHHHQPGTMPVYYSVYPPQQQLRHPHGIEHPYPYYFMPTQQGQAYNLPPPQPSYNESPHAVTSTVVSTRPDLPAVVYRMPAAPAPQYAGFPQIYHHQPQAMNHSAAATLNHNAYEFADPAHAHLYYNQPYAQQLAAAQYQTMSSAPAATLSDASPRLSAEKN